MNDVKEARIRLVKHDEVRVDVHATIARQGQGADAPDASSARLVDALVELRKKVDA